jgi:uncharacterized protein
MQINDVIYGKWEINEPILIDLIQSPSVQRLKNINQFAIPDEYHEIASGFSRFEHSIGVMLLLRMLKANLNEQITGLLHDVSHTAFSHLIDLIVGDETKEDYQDNRHNSFIKDSELPAILEKHGYNVDQISDHKTDSLLERALPDLCADRVDYGLREVYYIVDQSKATDLTKKLLSVDNKMVFADQKSANEFAYLFLDRQKNHWGSPSKMLRWHVFSQVIKAALNKKIISLSDFDRDDIYLMEKLISSGDHHINSVLDVLKFRRPLRYEITDSNPKIILKKKFRYVDPHFLDGNDLKKYSEVDSAFAKTIEEEKQLNTTGVSLNFEYERL